MARRNPQQKAPTYDHHQKTSAAAAVLRRCKVADGSGCMEWQGATGAKGYGRVKVGRTVHLTHRVVAWAHGLIAAPTLANAMDYVLHRCDNPRCCNPDHLFVGTLAQNMADCVAKGRHRHSRSNQRSPD